MSRRYLPSITENSDSTVSSSGTEPVVPHSSRADEIRVLAKGSQGQLCLVVGNKAAAAGDDLADLIQKEVGTFHNTTTQHNCVGDEHGDQVGQTQAKMVRFTFHSVLRPLVAVARQFADSRISFQPAAPVTGENKASG